MGEAVQLVFQLTQDSKDKQLMISLIEYFHCGNIAKRGEAFDFKITKFDHIINKIIPFFKRYSVIGVKSKDFKDFSKVAEIMKDKKHLTREGLEQIRKIKANMNTGRRV